MNPLTLLLIIISALLFVIVLFIPFIMSILDPKNIPDNLANYYSSKKMTTTIVVGVIMLVVVGAIWLYAFKFGLLN